MLWAKPLSLADQSLKSKDQSAALTSATTAPGRRGGEARLCCSNTDREHVGSSCFRLDIRKNIFTNEWSGIGTGCPGQWWSPHPWRGSDNM